jgi:bromodomain-containing protein 8
MNDAQLECTESDPNAPHALVNLKLAQKFYSARLLELRDLIAAEEVKFKTIVVEIQHIRAGKWDDKIRAKLSGIELEPEAEHDAAPTQNDTAVEPEVSHDVQEQEREPTPQPEEEEEEPAPVQETENIEPDQAPESVPVETESPRPSQTGEYPDNGNDEQPIELDETVASTHEEETEQSEWEQQPTSPDDEASEIEAILTPGAPEGSVDGEVSERSPEHEEESPVHEEKTLEHEEEETSPAQDTEHSRAEPEQEISMEVDAEQNLSVDTETSSQAKRKVDEVEVDDGEDTEEPNKKRLREESPPPTSGEEEQVTTRPRRDTASSEQRPSTPVQSGPSGSTAQSTTQAQPIPNKRFQTVISLLHSQISQHRNGNIFHNPIKPTEAPDYHDIIKRPMDLKTIKARIKDRVIKTSREFQRDVYLMFANAMMYNRPESDIALMAEEMMLESEGHINSFRQTEGYLRNARA